MRAILLAGGRGTRLHPLTEELPKPMVPVLGRPWLDQLLQRLVRQGVTEIVLSLYHGKDVITDYFRDGVPGARLRWAVEPKPLGTGGAIRFAAHPADETFLVFNADIVQTFDLEAFLDFHRSRRAQVTIGLVQVADPSSYGLVELDDDGRVLRFTEKPGPGTARDGLVNCGIYAFEPEVLDWIPPGREVSVEREVFPALLAGGARVYGCLLHGYWKDIGTLDRYLELHRHALAGRCPLEVPGRPVRAGVWQADGVRVAASARLFPPVALGPGTVVDEDAEVGPWVVTGAGCRIGPRARAAEAVLWDHAELGAGVAVRRSVLGYNTRVGGGTLEGVMLAAAGR